MDHRVLLRSVNSPSASAIARMLSFQTSGATGRVVGPSMTVAARSRFARPLHASLGLIWVGRINRLWVKKRDRGFVIADQPDQRQEIGFRGSAIDPIEHDEEWPFMLPRCSDTCRSALPGVERRFHASNLPNKSCTSAIAEVTSTTGPASGTHHMRVGFERLQRPCSAHDGHKSRRKCSVNGLIACRRNSKRPQRWNHPRLQFLDFRDLDLRATGQSGVQVDSRLRRRRTSFEKWSEQRRHPQGVSGTFPST